MFLAFFSSYKTNRKQPHRFAATCNVWKDDENLNRTARRKNDSQLNKIKYCTQVLMIPVSVLLLVRARARALRFLFECKRARANERNQRPVCQVCAFRCAYAFYSSLVVFFYFSFLILFYFILWLFRVKSVDSNDHCKTRIRKYKFNN